jgi:hypothetical protein
LTIPDCKCYLPAYRTGVVFCCDNCHKAEALCRGTCEYKVYLLHCRREDLAQGRA